MSSCTTPPLIPMASRVCRKVRPFNSTSLRGQRVGKLRTFSRSKTQKYGLTIKGRPSSLPFMFMDVCGAKWLAIYRIFERITCGFEAIFCVYLALNVTCPLRVARIGQEAGEHSRCAFGSVVFALDYFGYAKATHTTRIVRLVMAVGHHDHGFSGAKCLRCGANPSLMHDSCCPGKQL